MISHGNIVANINKGKVVSGLSPNCVSFHLLHRTIRVAQHVLQLGTASAQQRRVSVYLVKTPMSFLSGLGSFISPATSIIITDPSLEATLEAIARFVLRQIGHLSCYSIYHIQVSSHSCPFSAILHTRISELLPYQGHRLMPFTISTNLWFIFFA